MRIDSFIVSPPRGANNLRTIADGYETQKGALQPIQLGFVKISLYDLRSALLESREISSRVTFTRMQVPGRSIPVGKATILIRLLGEESVMQQVALFNK